MAKTGQEKKKAVGMQVRLIRENKADLIKTIEPQVIHNRFDVKFEDYDLLSLSDDNGNVRSYVPIRNGGERLEVGLYLRDPEILRGGGVHALAAHLFEHYPCSKEVFFLHTDHTGSHPTTTVECHSSRLSIAPPADRISGD